MNSVATREYNYFYFVQPGDSLSKILQQVYGAIAVRDHEKYLKTILANNPQINASRALFPGQCLDISPILNPALNRNLWAQDSVQMSRIWQKMPKANKDLAATQPDLTSKILKWTGVLIGFEAAKQDATQKQLQYINKLIEVKGEQIAALAKSRMVGAAKTIAEQIRSQQDLRLVEDALKVALRNLTKTIRNDVVASAPKSAPLLGTNLNRVQKVLVRIPNAARKQFHAYAPYLDRVAKIGKRAGKMGKMGSIVVPLSIASYEVAKNWNTPDRNKAIVKNTASVGAGVFGGWAGYSMCNAIFFAETGGTSVFWCGLVAGGLMGFGLSEGSEALVEKYYATQDVTPIAISERCLIPR